MLTRRRGTVTTPPRETTGTLSGEAWHLPLLHVCPSLATLCGTPPIPLLQRICEFAAQRSWTPTSQCAVRCLVPKDDPGSNPTRPYLVHDVGRPQRAGNPTLTVSSSALQPLIMHLATHTCVSSQEPTGSVRCGYRNTKVQDEAEHDQF